MTSTTDIANVLLPHVRANQEVVDLLFAKASVTSQVKLSAGLSDEVALAQVKGPLDRAVTVSASSHTGPAVLAKMSKDSRVTVRRALLANPSTPYETVLALNHWAHAKSDTSGQGDECISTAILRLRAADMVDVIEKSGMRQFTRHYSYPVEAIGKAVVETRDATLVKRAYAMGSVSLSASVATALYEQSAPSVSLTELLATSNQAARTASLAALADSQQMCSLELAELVASNEEAVGSYHNRFLLTSPGAEEALLASHHLSVRMLAISSGVRGELLDKSIEGAKELNELNALVASVGPQMSARQESAIIRRYLGFIAQGSEVRTSSLSALLSACRKRVSKPALLGLLRAGGGEFTAAWLSGHFPSNQPRPGELTSLVEEPGKAFSSIQVRSYYSRVNAEELTDAERLRNLLVACMNAALQGPWADEVALHLGENLLANLSSRPGAARYVTARFEKCFGSDMSCWESALSLAADWTSSIDELIETTYAINGVEPPEVDEVIAEKPEPLLLDL
jgi:hypothetical protein